MKNRLFTEQETFTEQGSSYAKYIEKIVQPLIDECIKNNISLRDLELILIKSIQLKINRVLVKSIFTDKINDTT